MEFRRSVSVLLIATSCALMLAIGSPASAEDPVSDVLAPTIAVPTTPATPPNAPGPSNVCYCSPFAGPVLTRSKLTGNWGGARDALFENGLTFDLSSTQYYQGVAANGIQQNFEYAGRQDYYVNLDGERAGLAEGFFLTIHGETRYGNTVNANTGSLMPVNVGMLFPTPNGTVSAITGLKATQYLGEDFAVFGGKLNMLDEWKQNYAAGRGVDTFMYTNLAFPVALARTVPYSTLGAGFSWLSDQYPVFTFMVLDTNNTPTTTGFESFFNNGATFLAKVDVPVEIYGLPGHQGCGGTFSTGSYANLAPTPYFNPDFSFAPITGSVAGSWSAYYAADQALFVDPNNPNRTWGIFKNFGVADNGPSPVRWSVAFGLGGASPLVSRPLDTFGVGYSWIQYATPVQNLAPGSQLEWDQAVECFYNVAVTPYFRITPDLQVLLPARDHTLPPASAPTDTVLVLGLRAKVDF